MAKALLPIRVIASDICEELGDNTEKYQFRILKYIALGYQQIHLLIGQGLSIQTVVLDPATEGTILELPSDFIYETKVGVMGPGNRICNLWLDHRMAAHDFTDTEQDEDIEKVWTGEQSTGYPVLHYYNYGSEGECLTGYGHGYRKFGRYRIDRQAGVLYASTSLPGKLVVEYKSDGLSEGLTLVPSEMHLALKNFAKSLFYADQNPRLAETFNQKWESQFKTLKRLYNHKPLDVYAQLFQHAQ